MDVYRTEDEQVDAIRRWWKDNYKALLGGVIIGLAILWGGSAWKSQREAGQQAASAAYLSMMNALEQDGGNVIATGKTLREQHGDTAYAAMAALATARVKLDQSDLAGAEADLRWAMDKAEEASLQQLARLRLARVLTAQSKDQEALDLLAPLADGIYQSMAEELKGDIHAKLGDTAQARAAYQTALAAQGVENNTGLLQMKLDNLGAAETAEQP